MRGHHIAIQLRLPTTFLQTHDIHTSIENQFNNWGGIYPFHYSRKLWAKFIISPHRRPRDSQPTGPPKLSYHNHSNICLLLLDSRNAFNLDLHFKAKACTFLSSTKKSSSLSSPEQRHECHDMSLSCHITAYCRAHGDNEKKKQKNKTRLTR